MPRRANILAFLAGLIFAVGLGVSGMTQPLRIIGFLDVFGAWDPTLLFVMGGAVLVYFAGYRFSRGMQTPYCAEVFVLPTRRDLDVRLIGGAVLFGTGWGLAGFCPGPAVTSLGSGSVYIILFVMMMLAGTYAAGALMRRVNR